MRRRDVSLLALAGLVLALVAGRDRSDKAFGQRSDFSANLHAPGLISHVTAPDGQQQTLTVIDPGERVVAVYHVDRSTGSIALKSVRNITWDLQMIEYNSGEPLPQDIRAAGPNAVGPGRHQKAMAEQ